MNKRVELREFHCLCGGLSARAGGLVRHRDFAVLVTAVILSCASFLFVSCAGPVMTGPALRRFSGAANADLIFRYFSDQVSHVEKPSTMEGPFLVACERPTVLKLAADQPRHELAVVILIRYLNSTEEDRVKLGWAQDLRKIGYHTVVFLLADRSKQIDGLPILPEPAIPAAVAKQ
jgi:hypothetical protein